MRKLIAALAIVATLVAAVVLVVQIMSRRAQSDAAATLAAIEPPAAFTARYPRVATKNASAAELEGLAMPLRIDLRPVPERKGAKIDLDEKVVAELGDWVDQQRDRPDDEVTPLPSSVEAWFAANDEQLSRIIIHLRTQPAAQWPSVVPPLEAKLAAPPEDESLPNLHSQMRLMKVLAAASLRAESRGDHARAWDIQEAAWRQARGLYSRPELISRIIAMAGIRLVAATTRKLEPPAPAWLAEMDAMNLRAGVFDSVRYEGTRAEARVASLRAKNSEHSWSPAIQLVTEPLDRWAFAELVGATSKELHRLTAIDPCSMNLEEAPARMSADLTPMARKLVTIQSRNLVETLARAAETEVAIDGSMRVLEVKRAIAAGEPVPHPSTVTCRDAQWVYESDGTLARVRFNGSVPQARIGKIPLHFVLGTVR